MLEKDDLLNKLKKDEDYEEQKGRGGGGMMDVDEEGDRLSSEIKKKEQDE